MLKRIAALILAAAFVSFAAPRAVRADNASAAAAPVTVLGCDMDQYHGGLNVSFRNTAAKEVTKVRFALADAGGTLEMADDVGSYAPADVVRHRLRVDPILLRLYADITCVPASVVFADGTSWQNPNQPSDMVQALAQTPGSQIALSRCFLGDGPEIDYTNNAKQDATEVDLGLVQRGLMVWKVSDKGTFSPGTLIVRRFRYGGDGEYVWDDMMQNRCVVLAVHYADGTTWENHSLPPASPKGIPFTVADPDPGAPITITNCDGSSARGGYDGEWRLNYQNASAKPIIAADFALVMHGYIEAAARDLHNLSPGDGNHVRYPLWDPNVYHPQCIPLRVNFTDGTTWYNPLFMPKAAAN